MFKLVLEKAEGPEIKLPTSSGSSKKQESSRKTSISTLLTMPKSLTVWITINCGKLWKRWEYQTTWPASWEICMQVRKPTVRTGPGTTEWFQIGKGVRQGCILSPCLFNLYAEYIMRNAGLKEVQAGIKIAGRNINNLRYADAAAAAKSRQSCPTLCNPIDGSPPGSPVPGILQARTLEWFAISFSNAWKWKVKLKSLSSDQLLLTPWTAAYQAPPSMGFSRQEY